MPIFNTNHAIDLPAADGSQFGRLNVRYWHTRDPDTDDEDMIANFMYPEMNLPEIASRPNNGITFAGGGMRACTAAFGIIRALRGDTPADDRMSEFRYMSGISGGGWFTTLYSFYPSTTEFTDAAFFGNYTCPALDLPSGSPDINIVDDLSSDEETNIRTTCTAAELEGITQSSLYLRNAANNPMIPDIAIGGFNEWWLDNYGQPPSTDDVTRASRAHENWSRAVGKALLEPYGLFTDDWAFPQRRYFTWSSNEVATIIGNNPQLTVADFDTVQHVRPYPIVGGSAFEHGQAFAHIFRSALFEEEELLGAAQADVTPLYTGVETSINGFGGGFVESCGFDSAFASYSVSPPPITGLLSLKGGSEPQQIFTMSDVLGVTGSAAGAADLSRMRQGWTQIGGTLDAELDGFELSEILEGLIDWGSEKSATLNWIVNNLNPNPDNLIGGEDGIDFLTPEFQTWSFRQSEKSSACNVIDGGYLDNLGIMPLLRRQVDRILVCDLPGAAFDENKGTAVTHLFGENRGRNNTVFTYWLGMHKNQVFDNTPQGGITPYDALLENLETAHNNLGVMFAQDTYQVVDNRNYGIRGLRPDGTPYEVQIFWYIMNENPFWTPFVNDTQGFDKFPGYSTFKLDLTNAEVALLAIYNEWSIRRIRPFIDEFFDWF